MPFRPTWLESDRTLARTVGRPLAAFLQVEAAGGLVLLVATIVAVVWANSPWEASYTSFWHTVVTVQVGPWRVESDLLHVINDGLMTLFFFVVGLEIKRELVVGDLRRPAAAILPAIAALGGMLVPAAIFLAVTAGGGGSEGWGIPMATDIAFALAVVSVLGSRVPTPLKVFLLTLAMVDDVGAIIVIAVFYATDLSLGWLALAAGLLAVVAGLRRANIRYLPVYVAIGSLVWLAMFESGVHATIAGVALGLLTPARPFQPELEAEAIVDELEQRGPDLRADDVLRTATLIKDSVSVAERVEQQLHPWTSFLVIPLFALANAGVALSAEPLRAASPVAVGVFVGLVVGKVVGITAFTWLATRLKGVSLPEGVQFGHILGIAAVAGIGFSVSLFIIDLAYVEGPFQVEAKTAVLAASVVAGGVGSVILSAMSSRSHPGRTSEGARAE